MVYGRGWSARRRASRCPGKRLRGQSLSFCCTRTDREQGLCLFSSPEPPARSGGLSSTLCADPKWKQAKIRALCHNRSLPEDERLTVVKGSISDRTVCEAAMRDVTHVVHL